MQFGIRHSALLTVIAGREDDDALGTRQDFLRVDAFVCVAFDPRHFAVVLASEPLLELVGVVGSLRGGEMAIVKAQFKGALANGFFHRSILIAKDAKDTEKLWEQNGGPGFTLTTLINTNQKRSAGIPARSNVASHGTVKLSGVRRKTESLTAKNAENTEKLRGTWCVVRENLEAEET
jgi:hypothetical protein